MGAMPPMTLVTMWYRERRRRRQPATRYARFRWRAENNEDGNLQKALRSSSPRLMNKAANVLENLRLRSDAQLERCRQQAVMVGPS